MAVRKKVIKNGQFLGYISGESIEALKKLSDDDIMANLEPVKDDDSDIQPIRPTPPPPPASENRIPTIGGTFGAMTGEEKIPGAAAPVAFGLGTLSSAGFGIPEKIPGIGKTFEMARERNPVAYGAGEVTGAFTGVGLPGLVQKGVLKGTGKILPKAGKLVKAGLTSGIEGAVQSGVETFVRTGKVDETLKSALGGAIIGTGIGAGFEKLSPVLNKVSDRTFKKMLKNKEFANIEQAYGKYLDDFVEGKFGTNIRNAEEEITKKVTSLSDEYDKLVEAVDKNIPVGAHVNQFFDNIIDKIKERKDPALDDVISPIITKINHIRKGVKSRGHINLTPKELVQIKREANIAMNPFEGGQSLQDAPIGKKAGQVIYKEVLEEIGRWSPELNKRGKDLNKIISLQEDVRSAIERGASDANIHPVHLMIMFGSAMSMSPLKAPGFIISGAQVGKGIGRTLPGAVATRKLAEQLGSTTNQMDVSRFLSSLNSKTGQ